ncbi:MAG: hypothetical protein VX346_14470 [Planctomycetota bacterium]|nr:hypothetical protein [Planctomycetota bacterium]
MTGRRTFLKATSAAVVAAPMVPVSEAAPKKRKRVAIVGASWRREEPTMHLAERLLAGYPYAGKWQRPPVDIVAVCMQQRPDDDLTEARAAEFGFGTYPTVAAALRCGGTHLAVDGVLLIDAAVAGRSDRQPRRGTTAASLLRQVVDVFQQEERAVPVFNYHQLGEGWDGAGGISEPAQRLEFPLLAGSVLPVTWRLPALELPLECVVEEALIVGGAPDPADYQALDALQCMVERRRGGETGVATVEVLRGDAVWAAAEQQRWSHSLLEAALSRSDIMMGENVHPKDMANNGEVPRLVKSPAAYCIEYLDGLRATVLNFHGAVGDYTFAARIQGTRQLQSTQFLLPVHRDGLAASCLVHQIVEMLMRGTSPRPLERSQLVTGLWRRCRSAWGAGQSARATPELRIRYRAPRSSQFCQT